MAKHKVAILATTIIVILALALVLGILGWTVSKQKLGHESIDEVINQITGDNPVFACI